MFICRFAQQWEDFRLPELKSVARIQGVDIQVLEDEYRTEVHNE